MREAPGRLFWLAVMWTSLIGLDVAILTATLLVIGVLAARVLLIDLHAYRLITRGRSWWPSKDPNDYL